MNKGVRIAILKRSKYRYYEYMRFRRYCVCDWVGWERVASFMKAEKVRQSDINI